MLRFRSGLMFFMRLWVHFGEMPGTVEYGLKILYGDLQSSRILGGNIGKVAALAAAGRLSGLQLIIPRGLKKQI